MSSGTFWKPAPAAAVDYLRDYHDVRNQEDAGMLFYPTTSKASSRAPLMHQRMLLPIYKHKRQICYAVEKYGVVVIVGETGSGKR